MFTVVEIDSDSNGTYTLFLDYRQEIPEYWKPGDVPYSLYKSPIQVRVPEPNRVQIYTQHFRFDYYLDGDTLQEFDKMGLQKKLVRIEPYN
ncbi:hypothetical protein GCM10023186_27230 [Hymenobacter koreensis]|uniref:Uncharacterized protein n=2 Tax=Hymenobacter koreensis TaxID=1084523 RepID=A0ABP8J425_9BACT